MSGHSKWATIKHQKAATDAKKGQMFTKFTKEIIVAARAGGSNPDMNFRLRIAIQRAKEQNMPNDNIERAIRRGSGEGAGADQMSEVIYEGYGPGGIAILCKTLTDNRNRTASEVRATFSKAGGSLAEAGAVIWQFEEKGIIVADAGTNGKAEEIELAAIDAGADDIETSDTAVNIYSKPDQLEHVRKTLVSQGHTIKSSELSMMPKVTVALDDKTAVKALKLLDRLEELDDVQRVFSNVEFTDTALELYQAEG